MKRLTDEVLAACLQKMDSGFLVTDANGVILYFNEAYIRLTKLPGARIGDNLCQYQESGFIRTEPACLAVLHEKRKVIRQFTQRENGIFIVSSSEPFFDEDHNIKMVITRVHDMTEFFQIHKDIENVRHIMEKMTNSEDQYDEYGTSIVALSEEMRAVLDVARKVAKFDLSVLLTGESGVGKDVVARYIHDHSRRKDGPFLAINCAAIPNDLLETELFGYAKGTFTGQASGGKQGMLAAAKGGTLFLDEIGDMPLNLQVKLLRVLESHQYMPVGSHTPVNTDVRIISATNQELQEKIRDKTFREDLYYRIKVVELPILPLRKRRKDIIPLSLFFIKQFNSKYGTNKSIDPLALQKLADYAWPGNVRELKNTIEMMLVLSPDNLLRVTHEIERQTGGRVSEILEHNAESNGREGYWEEYREPQEGLVKLSCFLDRHEKEYLRRAYEICGSTRKMGEVLGVDHSTIIRKCKKHGLHLSDGKE
ncbi:MAG: sigma 54-interacting transcriptional regulator [Ndongobacter sp.]|nr:sigma 54-interacting transcriptional regulator [Ndongobacter sp.]